MRTLAQQMEVQSKPLHSERLKANRPVFSEADFWGKIILLMVVVAWPLTFVIGFEPVLIVLNLAGLALAAIGLRYKSIGLLGITLLCTLDTLARNIIATSSLWSWNMVNFWLLVVMVVYLPFLVRINDWQSRLLQAFIFILALMLLISLDVSPGIQDVLNLAATFGIMIYFARAYREKNMLFWMAVISGATAALGGAAFYLQSNQLAYVNPNSLTELPLTALFAACLAMPQAAKIVRGRLVLLSLVIINVVWIFLSGSRGSLLTAFVCLFYLIVQLRSLTWTTVFILAGLGVVFWFSNLLLTQEAYALHRFSKFFDTTYTLAQRTSGRSEIFWTGWQIFLRQPLGIGTGSFREGADYLTIMGGMTTPAHSAWIKTLAENGVEGALIFTAWVLSFAVRGLTRKNCDEILLGLFVTAVLAEAFITQEFPGQEVCGSW